MHCLGRECAPWNAREKSIHSFVKEGTIHVLDGNRTSSNAAAQALEIVGGTLVKEDLRSEAHQERG